MSFVCCGPGISTVGTHWVDLATKVDHLTTKIVAQSLNLCMKIRTETAITRARLTEWSSASDARWTALTVPIGIEPTM